MIQSFHQFPLLLETFQNILKTFPKTILPPVPCISYSTYHFLRDLVSPFLYLSSPLLTFNLKTFPRYSGSIFTLVYNALPVMAPAYHSDLIFHHHPFPLTPQVQDPATLNFHLLKCTPSLTHSLHMPFPLSEMLFSGFIVLSFRSQKGMAREGCGSEMVYLSEHVSLNPPPRVFSHKPILITGTHLTLS